MTGSTDLRQGRDEYVSDVIDVVNISSVGYLGTEIDLPTLVDDLELPVATYDETKNAAFLRFSEGGNLIILYTSGSYIHRGGADVDHMCSMNDRFIELLSDAGIPVDEEPAFEIKNVIGVGDLGNPLDLGRLAIALGLEESEYEPEQFPAVIYKPEQSGVTMLLFSTGKVVTTGGRTATEDAEAFLALEERLDGLLEQGEVTP